MEPHRRSGRTAAHHDPREQPAAADHRQFAVDPGHRRAMNQLTIEMDFASREAWLQERRKGIGASDIAAILGCDPYRPRCDVWANKTGRAREDQRAPMLWGLRMEPLISRRAEERFGLVLGAPP